ncbi:MAG: methyltransferase domain-containing protein [Caldilinea sp. CFX5]|nr:methyltransferase domain-containing protein [Caldilinea sp. CFX5]
MQQPNSYSIEQRLLQVLQHLGLDQAHFAGRVPDDWLGLVSKHSAVIASLTLVCTRMAPPELATLGDRLLIFTGDQALFGEIMLRARPQLPAAHYVVLPGYAPAAWTDIAKERASELTTALTALLGRVQTGKRINPLSAAERQGEVASITYEIRGEGEPLVLLPLGFAPSGWAPVIDALSVHFCTIRLGGAELGILPFLEQRVQAPGYVRLLRNLLEEIALQPGEQVLDVGCGSGAVSRWVAHQTNGQNPILGVDINDYLLQEAQTLAKSVGVDHVVHFAPGNAEALPFPANHFDVVISTTVLEEVDADQALAELVRVTKPGGRIGVMVRALDLPRTINAPLRQELKTKVEAIAETERDEGNACASATLYRRFRHPHLTDIRGWPQPAVFANPQGYVEKVLQNMVLAQISPEEAEEYRRGVEQAIAEETFFITWPHHCVVGVKAGECDAETISCALITANLFEVIR